MTVWVLADIAIIITIIVSVYMSMKKGLVKASYNGLARIIAIILVFSFHASFQGYIEESFIGDTVRQNVRGYVQKAVNDNPQINEKEEKAESVKKAIEEMMLPDFIKKMIISESDGIENLKSGLADGIAGAVFPLIMKIIAIFLLYILVRVGLWILFSILKLIIEIPVLGAFDKGLGVLVGGINALLVIYIISAVLILFVPSDNQEWINSTILFKYFYNNNFLANLFTE